MGGAVIFLGRGGLKNYYLYIYICLHQPLNIIRFCQLCPTFLWFTVLKICKRVIVYCQLCRPNGAQLQSHSIVYQSDCYNSNTMHWICHHCMAKPMHCFLLLGQSQCTMWQTHCIVVCQNQCANTLHCDCIICQSYCIINMHVGPNPGGGGSQIIFLRSVRPEVCHPYPYLRILFSLKNGWIDLFSKFLANRDPFLRGLFIYLFFTLKVTDFTIFRKFCEMGPPFRIFLTKMGPMPKDFLVKK